MNVLSLFDGMSCGQIALERADITYCDYYASEIDKNCMAVTQSNYPDTIQIGDVTRILHNQHVYPMDLLLAGSPCQGFSIGGNGLNFQHPQSALFFEFIRILEKVKPTNKSLLFICFPSYRPSISLVVIVANSSIRFS